MYQIIGADGREYGPVTAEQLRLWIAENRVRPGTMVKPDGGHQWKPIAVLPEFSNLWPPDCWVAGRFPPAMLGHTTEEELGLFVGKNASHYVSRWQAMALSGSKFSWNWAACILGPSWTAYRKMYLVTWVFVALVAADSAIETGLGLSDVVGWGVAILIWVASGVFGNHLYLVHARRKIAEVKLAHHDPQVQRVQLARIGGASWGSAIGLTLLFSLVLIAVSVGLAFLMEADTWSPQ